MTDSTQPSRALLIAAGVLTQVMGAVCFILALASLPVAHDLNTGVSGVIASIIAALAAIVCGTLVWRGRLVPIALATGLDIGFGIGLPRGGSAIAAMLRILPADEASTAETLIMIAAVMMFVAAILCVISVPTALKLRQWAREEIARTNPGFAAPITSAEFAVGSNAQFGVSESATTNERPQAADTLRGMGPTTKQKLMPTMVIRTSALPPKNRVLIIAGVALTVIALGIIVISAALGSEKPPVASTAAGSGAAVAKLTPVRDAAALEASDAAIEAPPFDDFLTRFHASLTKIENLPLMFAADAFAFGVDSHDVAEGRDAVVAQLREDIGDGGAVTSKFSHVVTDADAAWFAEELRVGGKTFVISGVAGIGEGTWTIHALHWAAAMPNAEAYRRARTGELAIPDAINDTHDDSPLAVAMKTAFTSKPSFVEARSVRSDAFNFGSAGERLKGGETIKRLFAKIRANIRLHDAVKVGLVGERTGWGVANVDFTDADRDGTEVMQTFRVLGAWVKEDDGWRVVMTQWSNAR